MSQSPTSAGATSICPICANAESKAWLCRANLVKGTDHDLLECAGCGARFFFPMPAPEELEAFYATSYFAEFNRSRMEGRGRAFVRRMGRLPGAPPVGRFLDLGCAGGFFINGVRSASKWEVYGVDYSESAIRYAVDKLGIPAERFRRSTGEFPDEFFEFAHINNVIEHVPDPVAVLRDCRRVLRKNGLVYLSIPNGPNDSRSLIRYFEEEGTAPRSKDGHIVFLPPKALAVLFERAGFQMMSSRTYGFNRGLRNVGWLPRKKNWKVPYRPKEAPRVMGQPAETIRPVDGKARSDLYHRYRLFKSTFGFPGLHGFGLDYLFVLKPLKENRP